MDIEFFQLLADPSRFQIIELLQGGEHAVRDLVRKMSIQQSGVSRHLSILEKSGVVAVRADGVRRLYSLRPERFRELDDWMNRYRRMWEGRLDAFAEALSHKQRAANPKARRKMT